MHSQNVLKNVFHFLNLKITGWCVIEEVDIRYREIILTLSLRNSKATNIIVRYVENFTIRVLLWRFLCISNFHSLMFKVVASIGVPRGAPSPGAAVRPPPRREPPVSCKCQFSADCRWRLSSAGEPLPVVPDDVYVSDRARVTAMPVKSVR